MARSARTRTIEEFPFTPIAKELREGKCIPFLGAGASSFPRNVQEKPPSARRLSWELATEWNHPQLQVFVDHTYSTLDSYFHAKSNCEDLMLVSSWVEHSIGDRFHLNDKLRQHLANPQRPLPCNDLHKLLARVAKQKPMAIVTTNYDDLMEQALLKEEVPFDLFVVAIDRPAAEGRIEGEAVAINRPPFEGRIQGATLFRPHDQGDLKPVTAEQPLLDMELAQGMVLLKRTALFKIHGHIDRTRGSDDTFVITEEDYVSFLGRMGSGNSVIPADLVTVMQPRTLLFLGYGLRDWNLRVLLHRLNENRLKPKRSYAISHEVGQAESELWDARQVVVFDADLNQFVPRLDTALALPLPSP